MDTLSTNLPSPCVPETICLERRVRFSILQGPRAHAEESTPQRAGNSLLGLPSLAGLGTVQEVEICVLGAPDPATGYLVGIQELDRLVRKHVGPRLSQALADALRGHVPAPQPAALLALCAPGVQADLPSVAHLWALRWRPSPFLCVEWSPRMPGTALLSETFEFAAAHRLHCPDLTEAENRRIFGKCNNPNGHGHNYRVEVAVRVPLEGAHFGQPQLEDVVNRTIIDRWDHRHLNLDTEEFRTVNPSVENIAAACHRLLNAALAGTPAALCHVRVWETEKTSATYPAPAALPGSTQA